MRTPGVEPGQLVRCPHTAAQMHKDGMSAAHRAVKKCTGKEGFPSFCIKFFVRCPCGPPLLSRCAGSNARSAGWVAKKTVLKASSDGRALRRFGRAPPGSRQAGRIFLKHSLCAFLTAAR